MSFPVVTDPETIGFLTPFGPREIDTVPLDAVVEERIQHSVRITEHPIEVASGNGVTRGTIADNAYIEPKVYTMRGVVSDYPISWRQFRRDELTSYANSTSSTRSLSAYQLLLKHLNEMVPFTLVTPFGDLENMLFQRFSVPRRPQTKHAIMFDAEIRELQVVVPEPVAGRRSEEQLEGEQPETQAVSPVDRGAVSPLPRL